MVMKITYRGTETVVPDGGSAVIGADPEATVRIAKPGISRRHVVISGSDGMWVLEDAASKNGTFHNGTRIRRLELTGPTTVRLGHPTEGELVALTPGDREATKVVTPAPASRPTPARPAARSVPGSAATSTDPRLDDLVATLADTVKAVRGLTFSVWAMIAITAVLALLTLFVGILG